MLTEAQIGYFAGFFDGEGWISITPRHAPKNGKIYHSYSLLIGAGQCDPRPIELLKQNFGGSISSSRKKCGTKGVLNGHVFFSWQATTKKAEEFLRLVQPHLIHKKEQCEIALSWRNYVTKRPRWGTAKAPEEYKAIDREYSELIRKARSETRCT